MKRIVTVMLAVAATALLAWADASKLAKDLPSSGSAAVIVQYTQALTQTETNGLMDLGGLLSSLDLGIVNALRVTLPAASLLDLSNQATVKYISPDRPVHMTLD